MMAPKLKATYARLLLSPQIVEIDRAWFEAHPLRSFRVRQLGKGEARVHMVPEWARRNCSKVVIRFGEQAFRQTVAIAQPHNGGPDSDEAVLAIVYDALRLAMASDDEMRAVRDALDGARTCDCSEDSLAKVRSAVRAVAADPESDPILREARSFAIIRAARAQSEGRAER